ncbi:MAG TPA: amino acid ABC transporter substrate-binding protein [Thermopetrobacter sp.]|nr:amino acid ABC transporter substrate-binding protein [Thermopetrobacter sp.]
MKGIAATCLLAGTMLAGAAAGAMEVKIGFLGGFTGPIESMVPPIAKGAELAIAGVNAAGGVLNGEKVVMPTGDTTCADATKAADAADRLVNSEKVVAIVGALCSGATISAANNAAIPGGVVMISPASTSPALTTLKDGDLVFRTVPSDAFQGQQMAKLLKARGFKSIAVTYVNNDYGKGFAESLAAAFRKLGGTVAASEPHEDGKADYRAELGNLEASGAEILVILAYANGSGQTILRQALESGGFSKFALGDGMVSGELIRAIGADNLQGVIATRPGAPKAAGAARFAELAKKAGLDPKAIFAAQAYDAAMLLALAVEKNGKPDRAGLNRALRAVATAPGEVILPGEFAKAKKLLAEGKDINYEGAAGSHEFDANGDVPGVIEQLTVKDGKWTVLGIIE